MWRLLQDLAIRARQRRQFEATFREHLENLMVETTKGHEMAGPLSPQDDELQLSSSEDAQTARNASLQEHVERWKSEDPGEISSGQETAGPLPPSTDRAARLRSSSGNGGHWGVSTQFHAGQPPSVDCADPRSPPSVLIPPPSVDGRFVLQTHLDTGASWQTTSPLPSAANGSSSSTSHRHLSETGEQQSTSESKQARKPPSTLSATANSFHPSTQAPVQAHQPLPPATTSNPVTQRALLPTPVDSFPGDQWKLQKETTKSVLPSWPLDASSSGQQYPPTQTSANVQQSIVQPVNTSRLSSEVTASTQRRTTHSFSSDTSEDGSIWRFDPGKHQAQRTTAQSGALVTNDYQQSSAYAGQKQQQQPVIGQPRQDEVTLRQGFANQQIQQPNISVQGQASHMERYREHSKSESQPLIAPSSATRPETQHRQSASSSEQHTTMYQQAQLSERSSSDGFRDDSHQPTHRLPPGIPQIPQLNAQELALFSSLAQAPLAQPSAQHTAGQQTAPASRLQSLQPHQSMAHAGDAKQQYPAPLSHGMQPDLRSGAQYQPDAFQPAAQYNQADAFQHGHSQPQSQQSAKRNLLPQFNDRATQSRANEAATFQKPHHHQQTLDHQSDSARFSHHHRNGPELAMQRPQHQLGDQQGFQLPTPQTHTRTEVPSDPAYQHQRAAHQSAAYTSQTHDVYSAGSYNALSRSTAGSTTASAYTAFDQPAEGSSIANSYATFHQAVTASSDTATYNVLDRPVDGSTKASYNAFHQPATGSSASGLYNSFDKPGSSMDHRAPHWNGVEHSYANRGESLRGIESQEQPINDAVGNRQSAGSDDNAFYEYSASSYEHAKPPAESAPAALVGHGNEGASSSQPAAVSHPTSWNSSNWDSGMAFRSSLPFP